MNRFLGVDVGGTKAAAVLIDEAGTTLASRWTEHEGQWHGRLVETVTASIEALLAEAGVGVAGVDAIGVAVAGLVGRDRSTLVHSPLIRETHLDLGTGLSERLGRHVTVDNDANATLYGIAWHDRETGNAPPDPDRVWLLLTLGTGLGGAIMVGDEVLVGAHGFAAELGHVSVDYTDERTCACGSRGCVEQFASGRGLEELARLLPPPEVSVRTLEGLGLRGPVSARGIVAAAGADDPWATGLLDNAGIMLGRALSILCVTLDPAVVIVGGSLGHAAGRWLLPAARREMLARWVYPAERPLPRLALDSIGPYAAASGAALLAAASRDKEQANA